MTVSKSFSRSCAPKRREDLLSCSTFLSYANVYERSDKLLYVEVPGLDRKDLDVKLDGNVLSAQGERKFSRGFGNKVWTHVVRFG